MSSHSFKSLSGGYEVVVGWDSPLNTFFAQVAPSLDCDAADLHLWVGVTQGEISSIEELQRHLAPYAEIPEPVKEELVQELERLQTQAQIKEPDYDLDW